VTVFINYVKCFLRKVIIHVFIAEEESIDSSNVENVYASQSKWC